MLNASQSIGECTVVHSFPKTEANESRLSKIEAAYSRNGFEVVDVAVTEARWTITAVRPASI